ncbi:MAG: DUF456 family protein [Phycisphaerales bacterium]
MTYAIATLLAIVNLLGPVLTLIGLPGIWVMLAIALAAQYWPGDLFSWWTIGVCVGLGLLGELIEFLAGSLGASGAGGSKRAALGAFAGGVIGAIAGSATPPVIGAIIWGVVGAGLGAIIGEAAAGRSSDSAWRVGKAAAVGKFWATIVKTALAVIIYLTLTVAAFVH